MADEINPLIDIVRLVGAGVVGGLVATFAAHKLAGSRDRAAGIMAEKKNFIPLIDEMLATTANCGGLLGEARSRIRPRLFEPAMRFRLLLKNHQLRLFDDAWKTLINTTREEAENRQHGTTDAEFEKMKKLMLSRLEALRRIANEARY